MSTAVNVTVPIDDPDLLMEGRSPEAPFEVKYIQLYRYAGESNARADESGTLVDTGSGYTWELVDRTTAPEDPNIAGPFRYGHYDASQDSDTWYRFRFADSGLTTFSLLSDPWQPGATGLTLRELLVEIGSIMGDAMLHGEAESNVDAGKVVCAPLFQSSVRDPRLYEHWWVFVLTGDAAGEEAMIAEVNTATGTLTLERDLSAAVTTGNEFLVSCYMPVADMIPVINRAREKMQVRTVHDIALHDNANRYPVPHGVRAETDILDAVGVLPYYNSQRQDEFPIEYRVVFDGPQGWVEFGHAQFQTRIARLTCLRSYRDIEGPLEELGDETLAPVAWMRPAAAHAIAEHLVKSDPEFRQYQSLEGELQTELRMATGRYAPNVERRVKTGTGRNVRPGPTEVW